MENSSISILIAGAVLIIIALITLGMTVLNKGEAVAEQTDTQFEMMSIGMHNDLFEAYAKTDISYKEVKEIIASIANNNYTVEQKGIGEKVLLTVGYYSTRAKADNKEFAVAESNTTTFYVDDAFNSTTKNTYLRETKYTSRTYDCFVIKDTTRASSVPLAKSQGVSSNDRGIINEVIIVARIWP